MSEIEEKKKFVPDGYELIEDPNCCLHENDICMWYDSCGPQVIWRPVTSVLGLSAEPILCFKNLYLFARKIGHVDLLVNKLDFSSLGKLLND